MLTYTACRGCGDTLIVTDDTQRVHPGCPEPAPTAAEQYAQEWLALARLDEAGLTTHQRLNMSALETKIAELDAAPPRLRDAAHTYASWGWPVFPLMPREKRPATRNGFKAATTNADQIEDWWTRLPDCNIGLPTGINFDVIDVDVPDGWKSLQAMLAAGLPWDVHGKAVTASGGMHLLIPPAEGRGNKAGIMPGIDIRGTGGYIVAAPSTLGKPGRAWSWLVQPSPHIKEIR